MAVTSPVKQGENDLTLLKHAFQHDAGSERAVFPEASAGRDLVDNITLLFLPPYAPDAVSTKLDAAIGYIERKPNLVKSITSFPYIAKSF